MGVIRVLDSKVAELIAAGEVVERPASVVKELVENSVDAGASNITVEIRDGGVSYIRVTDDGCGMSEDDARLCFLRHATSKINRADDLYAIRSLGFRGEALASIAAVSRMEMFTRQHDADTGLRVRLEGSEIVDMDKAGCAPGTTFVVRDLFYNTPARMKFLKKNSAEAAAVGSLLDRLALCCPQVSIRYICDGKESLFTPGDSTLMGAVYAVYGRDTADTLIEADYTLGGISVSGYISRPLAARGSRKTQHFFLNGRLIASSVLTAALEEGYKNSIMTGKFPMCALHITIDPSLADVNVHPAKAQVKFADDRQIFEAVYWAVRNALASDGGRQEAAPAPAPRISRTALSAGTGEQQRLDIPPAPAVTATVDTPPANTDKAPDSLEIRLPGGMSYIPHSEQPDVLQSPMFTMPDSHYGEGSPLSRFPVFDRPPVEKGTDEAPAAQDVSAEASEHPSDDAAPQPRPEPDDIPARLLGEVFDTYYIAQQGDEVLLIDKHAAHERLIFEELKRTRRSDAQILLSPVTVRLDRAELAALLDYTDRLAEYGFAIEPFGPGTIAVREVPAFLFGADIKALIDEIAGALAGAKGRISPECEDEILHRMACRAAVKSGTPSNAAEQQALIDQLLKHPDVKYCPHGRPVVVTLTKQWFAKQFKRIP